MNLLFKKRCSIYHQAWHKVSPWRGNSGDLPLFNVAIIMPIWESLNIFKTYYCANIKQFWNRTFFTSGKSNLNLFLSRMTWILNVHFPSCLALYSQRGVNKEVCDITKNLIKPINSTYLPLLLNKTNRLPVKLLSA